MGRRPRRAPGLSASRFAPDCAADWGDLSWKTSDKASSSGAQPSPGSAGTDDWECDDSGGDIGEVLASPHRPASVASQAPVGQDPSSSSRLRISRSKRWWAWAAPQRSSKLTGAARWSPRRRVMRDTSDIGHSERVAFHREVNVLAKAQHPNLVRLLCVCFRARPWRIVTEFCAGGNVFQLLHVDNVDLTWGQRVKMLTDVAAGMDSDYLHWFPPPIIHRDLKSLNLLLTEAVRSPEDPVTVKVSDFGLARTKPADSGQCRTDDPMRGHTELDGARGPHGALLRREGRRVLIRHGAVRDYQFRDPLRRRG
ncbi:unnamed protein product, partial [Prorocentrum cordatum]